MRKLISLAIMAAVALGFTAMAAAAEVTITGAGASTPSPLYSKWARFYEAEEGKKVEFRPSGSSEGIRLVITQEIDFGASNTPLTQNMLLDADITQFPTAVTGIVPVVNIEGVEAGKLRLSGKVLAEIFMGDIVMWDDPRIRRLNPDLELPESEITVIVRSDGSGSSWVFTNYLSKVSSDWAEDVGFSNTPQWPSDALVDYAESSSGMVAAVNDTPGAIGYVGYTHAMQNKLAYVTLMNSSGNFVKPGLDTFKAAAAGARWQLTPGMGVIITDQAGINAWPITAATFVIIPRRPRDCDRVREVFKFFFDWAFNYGDEIAETLGYVPVPEGSTYFMNRTVIRTIRCNGEPLLRK